MVNLRIKRENFKGKYWVVDRDAGGHIKSRRKWRPSKGITTPKVKQLYAQTTPTIRHEKERYDYSLTYERAASSSSVSFAQIRFVANKPLRGTQDEKARFIRAMLRKHMPRENQFYRRFLRHFKHLTENYNEGTTTRDIGVYFTIDYAGEWQHENAQRFQ